MSHLTSAFIVHWFLKLYSLPQVQLQELPFKEDAPVSNKVPPEFKISTLRERLLGPLAQ